MERNLSGIPLSNKEEKPTQTGAKKQKPSTSHRNRRKETRTDH
jgi:hypothetical protein